VDFLVAVLFISNAIDSFILSFTSRSFIIPFQFISNAIDSFILSFTSRSFIIPFQYALMAFAIIYVLYYKRLYTKNRMYGYFVAIILYYGILSLFSSDLSLTFNYMIKFVLPLPFFAVGYSAFRDLETFKYFIERSAVLLLYFVVYIIVVSIFRIGPGIYRYTLVTTGYYGIQGLYIPTFLVIIYLFATASYKLHNRRWIVLLSALTFAIQIIILKRTNIMLLIIGVLLYLFYTMRGNFRKVIPALILLAVVFYGVTSTEWFESSYMSRYSRFSQDYSLTEEGRFMEYSFVWNQISKSADKLIFGTKEVFNDWETLSYEWKVGGQRQLHSSYAQLLWNGGLLGIMIFLMYKYSIFKKLTLYYSRTEHSRHLRKLGISLLILVLLNDLSGGITYLTYNTFIYILFGALLRIGREEYFLKHFSRVNMAEPDGTQINLVDEGGE
jgi:hypothetical protein